MAIQVSVVSLVAGVTSVARYQVPLFVDSCAVTSTWPLRRARVHRNEMILHCRIGMAVERVLCLVCSC